MTLAAVKKQKEDILGFLKDKNVSEIILCGGAGMGKTWMAREIYDHEKNSEELCYATLWLSMNRRYDEKSLYENIAHQLSLLSTAEEWNGDDDGVELNIPENLKKQRSDMEENTDDLKKKISEELSKRRSEGKFILLFLDNEGEKTKREFVLSNLGLQKVLSQNGGNNLKILITMRGDCEGCINVKKTPVIEGCINVEKTPVIEGCNNVEKTPVIEGCSNVEKTPVIKYCHLPERSDVEEVLSKLLKENVCNNVAKHSSFNELSKAIVQRSNVSPASIIVLAGALNEFTEPKSGVCKLSAALKEAIDIEEAHDSGGAAHSVEAAGSDKETDGKMLVCSGHDTLPNAVMVNCFWHSWQCFCTHGAVHFNELIAHWIMEGYLDPRDSMEQAYHKGHSVVMQLIDQGLLKIQEDNIVAVEGAAVNMIDCHCRDFYGRSHL
ncbi:hypothetical protein SLEP1_g60244, partial [Rubroshorea leprosula]